jgi:hypothetical protein
MLAMDLQRADPAAMEPAYAPAFRAAVDLGDPSLS